MLTYLTHEEIDFKAWDACVEQAPNGIIYGLSWYLNIVSPGWHGVVKKGNGGYVGVLPVPVARKFGMWYVRQPLFAQQLGFFSTSPLAAQDYAELSRLLRARIKQFSSYGFNTENREVLEHGLEGFEGKEFNTYHLSLAQGYEQLVAGYRKDRRWRINKAKRSNLSVVPSEDVNLMLDIFHEHITPKIAGVIGEDYEYKMLRQLYCAAKERGLAQMYATVDAQNQVLAMGLFFFFNRKIIYIYNASTPEGKRQSAISLLVDYVLQKYAGQEMVFDFEAPEVEQIADFYSSFGSEKAPFLSISLSNLPAPIKFIKNLRMALYRNFLNKK